jgi:hypothetical protein
MSAASIGKEMTPAGGLLAPRWPTNLAWLRAGGVLLTGYGTSRLKGTVLASPFNWGTAFYCVLTLGGLAASFAWAHAELCGGAGIDHGQTRRAPPRPWVEWTAVLLAGFGAHSLVKLVASRTRRGAILEFVGDVAVSNAAVAVAVLAVSPAAGGEDLCEDVLDLLADHFVGPTGEWAAATVAAVSCLAAERAVVPHFVLASCGTGVRPILLDSRATFSRPACGARWSARHQFQMKAI